MENKNTGLKVLVGILLVLVIAMGGFIFYREVLNKKEGTKKSENAGNNIEDNTNQERLKDVVSFESLEKIGTITNNDDNGYFRNIEYFSKNGDLILSYPVINIESSDVATINKKLKESALEIKKQLLNGKKTTLDDDMILAKLSDGTGYIENYFYDYYYYRVVETDKYISIIETSQDIGHKEDNSLKAVYIIDKKNGKSLSKEEIAKTFKYNNYSKLSNKIMKELGYEKYTEDLGEYGTSELSRELVNIFITNNNKLGIIFNEEEISGDYYYRFFEQTSDSNLVEYEF